MDATLQAGATCTSGLGVELDGINDYVDLADVTLEGDLSMAMWLKLDTLQKLDGSTGNRHQYLAAFYDSGYNNEIRLYIIANSLRFCLVTYAGLDDCAWTGWNFITESDTAYWMHVAATLGGSTMKLYFNGTLIGSTDGHELPVMQRVHHHLGRSPWGNYIEKRLQR